MTLDVTPAADCCEQRAPSNECGSLLVTRYSSRATRDPLLVTSVSDTVIDVVGLRKEYGGLRPLRLQHLAIRRGERVVIAGLDAHAAETLVSLVIGASLPDEGEVIVFGGTTSSIASQPEWLPLLDRFGLVSDRAALLDSFSIAQNIAVPLTLEIEPLSPDTLDRVGRLAVDAGLDARSLPLRAGDVAPTVRLRVRLARALALDPAVLLLEHPTTTLSAVEIEAFANVVDEVARRRKLTVLAITQDRSFGRRIGDRRFVFRPATGALDERSGIMRSF